MPYWRPLWNAQQRLLKGYREQWNAATAGLLAMMPDAARHSAAMARMRRRKPLAMAAMQPATSPTARPRDHVSQVGSAREWLS